MSIVEYHVTPTHRYFMRRTKREIVRKMQEMSGRKFSDGEYANLLTLTKDQLATRAMQIVRKLPDGV